MSACCWHMPILWKFLNLNMADMFYFSTLSNNSSKLSKISRLYKLIIRHWGLVVSRNLYIIICLWSIHYHWHQREHAIHMTQWSSRQSVEMSGPGEHSEWIESSKGEMILSYVIIESQGVIDSEKTQRNGFCMSNNCAHLYFRYSAQKKTKHQLSSDISVTYQAPDWPRRLKFAPITPMANGPPKALKSRR